MYNRKGSFSKHLCPKNPFGHLEEEKGTNHRTRLASSLRLWSEIKVHSDELKNFLKHHLRYLSKAKGGL